MLIPLWSVLGLLVSECPLPEVWPYAVPIATQDVLCVYVM